MQKLIKLFLIPAFALLMACNSQTLVDTSNITIEQEFKRFEKDLFNIPTDSIWDYVPLMENKYPTFFNLFNTRVISIGPSTNFSYAEDLAYFLSDPDIHNTYQKVEKLFTPLFFERELHEAFKRYHHFFPETTIPDIYTHISGFNQSIIIDSSYLSISLDKYLGSNSKYYQMLRTPNYLSQTMHPAKIPSDVIMAFLMIEQPNNSEKQNLISEMVYYGKIHYAMEQILPNQADSLLWGMSDAKLNWAHKNEQSMWMYLIEHKQLFSSNHKDIIRYIDDGPFTAPFSKQSPGKSGRWLGYRIVKSYMEENKSTSLIELFNEKDHQKILNDSKYKP